MIGRHISELDTPALCIDLNAMEANIATIHDHITSRGKHWRPHEYCHQSPAIAKQLVDAGAVGVTCANLFAAEAVVGTGIRDVLIYNIVVGQRNLERVAKLCRSVDPILTVDHFAQAEALSNACDGLSVRPQVVVEINLGMNRCGIRPGIESLRLFKGISNLPHIQPVGIIGDESHLHRLADPTMKRDHISDAVAKLSHTRDMILNEQLTCNIVSVGGTGSYQAMSDCDDVTEIRAGGGIFGGSFYSEDCSVVGLSSALSLQATVLSRPSLTRGVIDAGRNSFAIDPCPPILRDFSECRIDEFGTDRTAVELTGDGRDLRIGDRVVLDIGYANSTTNRHRRLFGLRGEYVETVFEARQQTE